MQTLIILQSGMVQHGLLLLLELLQSISDMVFDASGNLYISWYNLQMLVTQTEIILLNGMVQVYLV